jgi:hypothetical protein
VSPVKRPSSVTGMRRAMTSERPDPVVQTEGVPVSPVLSVPSRGEKPVRITLDLSVAVHRMLKQFAAESGAGVSAASVLRALLAELGSDPDLAGRVRGRIWEASGR